ncbi:restriction endonuclease [Ruoffia sp. FAM 24228]|uniref:restriction endonuclease n=1 Tax=Ruoffia TaxID=2862144 RepID=UPI0022A69339|nr:restriction endonuclease [Ruoffia tabacinasalis]
MRGIEYDNSEKSQSILYNRIGFALADLYKAKAIIRTKRAVYKITDDGLSLLNEYGDQLTTDILQEQTEYVAYMKELESRNIKSDKDSEDILQGNLNMNNLEEQEDPQETVERLINKRNNEVEIELLNKLRETDPIFFEKLVIKLLNTMGYSGNNGNVHVTTQSNDGGIDGIINQDPLGTSRVYLQVKRYAEKCSRTPGHSRLL